MFAVSVIGASAHVPTAAAVPGPEVGYVYNVMVRRYYDFSNNDAIGYGFGICDKVAAGVGYPQVMADVKNDVLWQLRNSAAGHRAPQ